MIMITRIVISKCSRAATGDNKGWDNYGYSTCTQGLQGPQKLSSLKSRFLYYSSKMVSKLNSMWQNRKEHPNRSTNNGYIVEKAKHP